MRNWRHAHRGPGMTGIRSEGSIDLAKRFRKLDMLLEQLQKLRCDMAERCHQGGAARQLTARMRMVLMAN